MHIPDCLFLLQVSDLSCPSFHHGAYCVPHGFDTHPVLDGSDISYQIRSDLSFLLFTSAS